MSFRLVDFGASLGSPVQDVLASEYGHLGAANQLFCLSRYSKSGELRPGDWVALVSRGSAMRRACPLIEV